VTVTTKKARRVVIPRLTIPPEIKKAQFESLTGYSSKQITRWVQETDIPHRRDGNELYFPWPGVRAWLFGYLEAKGKRSAAPESFDDARKRKEIAEAEMAEIELATARNELVRTADAEAWFADACARVRARMDSLGPRAAAAAFGAETVQEAQARIQPVVDEVYAELRKTDDVPDMGEDLEDDGDGDPAGE